MSATAENDTTDELGVQSRIAVFLPAALLMARLNRLA